MQETPESLVLTLGLIGVGVYFSVRLVRGFALYLFARRLRPTALVTWSTPPPTLMPFLVLLGIVAGGLAILAGARQRPFFHVYSQAVTALYFVALAPLLTRIRRGLYRDGVFADAGFLRYAEIGRLAFRETPEIVLLLLPRGKSRPFQLSVPPEEYGTVRKLLAEKTREHELEPEQAILGL